MDEVDVEDLPLGVVVLDEHERIRAATRAFLEWCADPDPIGRPASDFLVATGDFLDGIDHDPRLMLHPGVAGRAALVSRTRRGDGWLLTVTDATSRFTAGSKLRQQLRLADRTRTRLELVIDSAVALAEAHEDERLAEILAEVAASAYAAEDSAVYLSSGRSHPVLAAGVDPFAGTPAGEALLQAAMAIDGVVQISGADEGAAVSTLLGDAMRAAGVHALIAAPLVLDDSFFGFFACAFHHPRSFDDEAAPLALALSNQAAQALTSLRLQRELAHAATHDDVTGLPNRRALEGFAGLSPGYTVLFLDLDGFKEVNDTVGHDAGDRVLREVAHRLESAVRTDDIVARYGGDEFVVVCSDLDDREAMDLAERLRHAVAEPYGSLEFPVSLGASIGIAVADLGDPPLTLDLLLRRADQAMYEAKRAGGGRVAVAP